VREERNQFILSMELLLDSAAKKLGG